jgi:cytochrome b561/polyisoprenoid-binding protein YceI
MHAETEVKNDADRYTGVAKILHWGVAGAIVLQYVLANLADGSESKFRELVLLANHKSVGITILVLALARIGWRFLKPPPAPVPMPGWQRIASAVSHSALYALIILMPLSGWLMSSASNIPVSWFNLFQLPDVIGPHEGLAELFEETHEAMASILFVIAAIHIGAALKHAVIDRDDALRRITSPASLVLFVVVIVAGLLWLRPANADDAPAPAWLIDYEDSYVRFEAEQAGARFEGEWTDWQASIRFDPAGPSGSFDVSVRVAGVATGDAERDDTLMDPEFFDSDDHPVVRYRADVFSAEGDDVFTADGSIEVKGIAIPAPLRFTIESEGGMRVLMGSARLDRLALGIGTGEWEDTSWIGRYVDVAVRVAATVDRD